MVSTVSHYFQVPASPADLAVWICLVHPSCFSLCNTCNTMLEVKTPQVKTPAGRTPVQCLPQMPSNSSTIFSACNLVCSMIALNQCQHYIHIVLSFDFIRVYFILFYYILLCHFLLLCVRCRGVQRNMATAKASEKVRNI